MTFLLETPPFSECLFLIPSCEFLQCKIWLIRFSKVNISVLSSKINIARFSIKSPLIGKQTDAEVLNCV